jgi:GTPase involved in cell partitioning and DNA repair
MNPSLRESKELVIEAEKEVLTPGQWPAQESIEDNKKFESLKIEMRQHSTELVEMSKSLILEKYDKRFATIEQLQERLRLQLRAAEEQIISNSECVNILTQQVNQSDIVLAQKLAILKQQDPQDLG